MTEDREPRGGPVEPARAEDAPDRDSTQVAIPMALGIALGAGIGAALGNLAIGIAVGVALGGVIGAARARRGS